MLYGLLRILFSWYFKIFFRARVEGCENMPADGAVILAANHLSNWDPPLLACFLPRPVSYMAKIELFANPIFGSAIKSCHAFPVKRGGADRSAIKTALEVLKGGRCLGLFPEGTRSKTGELGKAEGGVALIAALSGAPVVPAAIVGTDKVFKGPSFLPQLKLVYGRPLKFTGSHKNKADLAAFSGELMTEIGKLKENVSAK